MRLTYQTGAAALVQLGTMTVLNILNGGYSIATQCQKGDNDCVGNLILSLLYFILLTSWFAALWMLAAAAQERRSPRLALLLAGAEGLVLLVSVFNARHHNYTLGLVTSLIDAALALWIIALALRLAYARGGRVTRRRIRKPTGTSD